MWFTDPAGYKATRKDCGASTDWRTSKWCGISGSEASLELGPQPEALANPQQVTLTQIADTRYPHPVSSIFDGRAGKPTVFRVWRLNIRRRAASIDAAHTAALLRVCATNRSFGRCRRIGTFCLDSASLSFIYSTTCHGSWGRVGL